MASGPMSFDPSQAWVQALRVAANAQLCRSQAEYRRWKRYRATWRRIFRFVDLTKINRVLEVGVGGGSQLMPFALNGIQCCGIDCSRDVLDRALACKRSLEKYHGKPLEVRFVLGDWLSDEVNAALGGAYDLVFNRGVIEHYLDNGKRIEFLAKKLRHLRPGGWLISIVPSGIHPLRNLQRINGWGGYSIPEVDYDPHTVGEEAEAAGATAIRVLPHRHFGYLVMKPGGRIKHLLHLAMVALGAIPGAGRFISSRRATSFILIGQKP